MLHSPRKTIWAVKPHVVIHTQSPPPVAINALKGGMVEFEHTNTDTSISTFAEATTCRTIHRVQHYTIGLMIGLESAR